MSKLDGMITYEKLSHRPRAAPSLMGMTLETFEQVHIEFALAHSERLANLTATKRKGTPRQGAVGAGGHHRDAVRERLLMPLFWLRVYTTYEVWGFFYALNKTKLEDNPKDILATLDEMTPFTFGQEKDPSPQKPNCCAPGGAA